LSELGLDLEQERDRRKRRRRRGFGCIPVLVVLLILGGGGYLAYNLGSDALKDRFSGPEDYTGGGTGSVLVEVKEGDAASDIAATLVEKDVVKSQEAFTEAAVANPDSRGIQVGFYDMKKQMSAESALDILVNPDNIMQNTVAFPEGWTVDQIVAQLAKKTDFSAKQYTKVLRNPDSIGLPSYAGGDAEGYLFPATYQVKPNATPKSILTMLVDRYKQAAEELDLEAEAAKLGVSPHDVMVVASLVQAEARFDDDFAKVSRVIYNRLDEPMPLQFDSTVHYAVGRDGKVGTSDDDRNVDSPYNTYKQTGLPPTPIMAPGEQAMEAALNPTEGPWLYFVTTNPDTGETKFAESYQDHLRNKAEFDAWCAESDHC
jgi:UPF0755 protein